MNPLGPGDADDCRAAHAICRVPKDCLTVDHITSLMPFQNRDRQIAVIGDVHAEHDLLELALVTLRGLGVHRVLCVGDIVDGFGSVDRCCELLREHGVVTVRGNHDSWMLSDTVRNLQHATHREDLSSESLGYIESLPASRSVGDLLPGAMLCHGLGPNDMASVRPDDYGYALEVKAELHDLMADPDVSIVFNGHTHRRIVRHFRGLTIVNAGTLHRNHEPGFVVVDQDSGDVSWLSLREPDIGIATTLGRIGV
jgi:predicted phosphodiesterase